MVVSKKDLTKAYIKADGSPTKTAKILGIKKQSVFKRVKRNPDIQLAVIDARLEAIKKSGLNRLETYKTIRKGLKSVRTVSVFSNDAKGGFVPVTEIDYKVRLEYSKLILQLFRDLEPEKENQQTNVVNLILQVMSNPNREVIEVV